LAQVSLDPRLGNNARLDAIGAVIDWTPLEALAKTVHPGDTGRPPYPPGAMIRMLYVQMLYGLSDPALEEAMTDRLSFRRFCGISLDQPTPDFTTIWRFRTAAAAAGVMTACFEAVVRQLDAKGPIVRTGSLVDATLIPAASRKPGIKAGKAAKRAREPGASWTRKNGKSHYGYRLHIATDKGFNIIRRVAFTPAHVAESSVAEALISGSPAAVYADKGYESKRRRAALNAAGIKDRICHRSHKHMNALPHWQLQRNKAIAKRRSAVERVFGTGKRGFGYVRARSTKFMTNLGQAFRFAPVFNLRRAAGLAKT
jgi:IS5 family transposase